MAEPFLRWAGGKRWLARTLAPLLVCRLGPSSTYFEPFLGGGALFFALEPANAVLSDLNGDLVTAYKAVAWRRGQIASRLAKLRTSSREYARVKKWVPATQTDRAVRLIYLNRNCYGGLYRENKNGKFNVPFGGGERNHLALCENGILQKAANVLRHPGVALRVADFGDVIPDAGEGDIVYCDPTYREVTRSRFDRYGKAVFDWRDQERLAKVASAAFERGALVLLSNGTSTRLRRLYRAAASIKLVRRKGLGRNGDRRLRTEYLLVLDPATDWNAWSSLGHLSTP
jgi:DNA adenine methylase